MKSHIPELTSATVFDKTDLEIMQRAFERACQDLRLAAADYDARQAVARAIFVAYQDGRAGPDELYAAAHVAASGQD